MMRWLDLKNIYIMATVFRKANDLDRNVDASLYIGNIDAKVTEALLYELFIQFAPVRFLNLPQDRVLRSHQGYGFIEFKSVSDTDYVLLVMKGVRLYGKMLRLRRLESSKSSTPTTTAPRAKQIVDVGAKIFINNLNTLVDEKYLADTFGSFGKVIDQEVVRDAETGESKCHGFVTFEDFDSSDNAIKSLDGKMLMNSKVSVSYAYKSGTKQKVKHGDKVERILAANAKRNLSNSGSGSGSANGQPKSKKRKTNCSN